VRAAERLAERGRAALRARLPAARQRRRHKIPPGRSDRERRRRIRARGEERSSAEKLRGDGVRGCFRAWRRRRAAAAARRAIAVRAERRGEDDSLALTRRVRAHAAAAHRERSAADLRVLRDGLDGDGRPRADGDERPAAPRPQRRDGRHGRARLAQREALAAANRTPVSGPRIHGLHAVTVRVQLRERGGARESREGERPGVVERRGGTDLS
jgi:hypothetical protein